MSVIEPSEVVLASAFRAWPVLNELAFAFLFHVSPSGGLGVLIPRCVALQSQRVAVYSSWCLPSIELVNQPPVVLRTGYTTVLTCKFRPSEVIDP